MAQRIQALLNAGLCLIISREGLSVVPRKKETGRVRWRETEKQSGGKIERRGEKASTRSSRSCGERRVRERHVPVATLLLSHDGFYVSEKNFDKILLLNIFSPPISS